MIRPLAVLFTFALVAWLAGAGAARAQMAADTSLTAPPVAPPLKTNSPLYHLTYDPKLVQLPIGYREGETGGGDFFIGHRGIDNEGGQGWGWLRKSTDDWGDGKWIALQEQPGLAVAPFRKLTKRDGDADWEFRMWGHYATYKAYDPHLDELLPVFVLQGYQVLGPAAPLRNCTSARPAGRSRAAAAPRPGPATRSPREPGSIDRPSFDISRRRPDSTRTMTPLLPTLLGGLSGWALLGVKILGAFGFMAAANLVILYAS